MQSCSAPLLVVRLQLLEAGSVFEPTVGGDLSDLLKKAITDVYTTASLLPRISVSRHGNYQVTLRHSDIIHLVLIKAAVTNVSQK